MIAVRVGQSPPQASDTNSLIVTRGLLSVHPV